MEWDVFGRMNDRGNVDMLITGTGEPVTRMDFLTAYRFYPVGSELSVMYEHPDGIELSLADAQKLGCEIEIG